MKAQEHLVVGGGLLGLSTALELLRRGHRVRVIEAQEGVGLGTSFANGGLLTPSMADPWNGPGVHRHLIASLTNPDSAMKLRPSALPSLIPWGARFLINSRRHPHRIATIANFKLATYSLRILRELRETYSLSYDALANGTLKVFRSSKAFESSMAMTRLLDAEGLRADTLDADGAVAIEPQLADIRDRIVGALHYPDDESGDAYLYCRAVERVIDTLGGNIERWQQVRAIARERGRVSGVHTADGFIPADSVIISAGNASPAIASSLGVRLGIKPAKGYSITLAMAASGPMPKVPVVDDALHVAVTPLGGRLRIAGTAEFARFDMRVQPKQVANLIAMLRAIYPSLVGVDPLAAAETWVGLRPMTADGRPIIGPARIPGLWINSGHGHLGWTMAAGSARLLADLIEGRRSDIDPEPFAVHR